MTVTGQWSQHPAPAGASPRPVPRVQALEDLRQKMHQFVVQELGPLLYDQRLSEAEIRKQVEEQLHRAMAQERLALGAAERQALVQDVSDDILGYGPIDRLSARTRASPRSWSTAPSEVYIERDGKIERSPTCSFVDETHLRRIIDKIVGQVGRRVDEATPDGRRPPPRRLPCQRRHPPARRSAARSSRSGSSPRTRSRSRT